MNKKGGSSSGGIGFFGVLIVLILFFGVRGCIKEEFQEAINEFCIEEGFEYGEETVINTVIECRNFSNEYIAKIKYERFQRYINSTKEVDDDTEVTR